MLSSFYRMVGGKLRNPNYEIFVRKKRIEGIAIKIFLLLKIHKEITFNFRSYLYLYTIMIADPAPAVQGFYDNLLGIKSDNSLQEMADIAKEYLSGSSKNKNTLTCQYTCTIDQVELINHFNTVVDSLRYYKPTLINNNDK